MTIQNSLFLVFVLIIGAFYSSTTSAQLSLAASPPSSTSPVSTPTAPPAAAPGLNTVPLVPASPSGAPTPAIPKAPTIDIVQILRKAKRFSVLIRLLKTTQLINQLNSQLTTSGSSGGLTVFAPEDSAFSKLKPGFLNSLGDRQKVELLQFHTISSFVSISNFDTLTNPVQTQAGDDPKRLQLNVTTDGGSRVSMTTGAVNATVTGTVYTNNKLAIYQVDKVLLPLDFVLPKAAPAPSPAVAAKADSPKSDNTKSSSANENEDSDDNANKANTVEASAGSVNVHAAMIPLVIVSMAFLGGAMI
ncbi:fasciclin-like arabinogalactan protein 12 [Neltuma alba]|uniref:fasciclin-like arabinogalactan protein 12 n=1 Tax=Neltuma alba TaxID=207710 RepID=UPI0010A51B7F|nr:fasciclin-like arabinogalactan protein 12 [Prosopis alba]